MHRRVILIASGLAAALFSTVSCAENPGFERVLSAVTLSFDAHSGVDRAVLVENLEDGADLYIYLGVDSARTDAPKRPALVKKNAAWSGSMWGTRPSLAVSDKGSLLIRSANEAVGRGRWSQTLTIAYRGGHFVVAGIRRQESDTLNPKAGGSCDLNLLTGAGLRNRLPADTKFPAMKLAEWSDANLPRECAF